MSDSVAEVRLRALTSLAERLDAANEEFPSLEAFLWNHHPEEGTNRLDHLAGLAGQELEDALRVARQGYVERHDYPDALPLPFRYRDLVTSPGWALGEDNHIRNHFKDLIVAGRFETPSPWSYALGVSPRDRSRGAWERFVPLAERVQQYLLHVPGSDRLFGCEATASLLHTLMIDERFEAWGRHPENPSWGWVRRSDGRVHPDQRCPFEVRTTTVPVERRPACWCAYIPRVFAAIADFVRGLACKELTVFGHQQVGVTDRAKQAERPTQQPNLAASLPTTSVTESPPAGSHPAPPADSRTGPPDRFHFGDNSMSSTSLPAAESGDGRFTDAEFNHVSAVLGAMNRNRDDIMARLRLESIGVTVPNDHTEWELLAHDLDVVADVTTQEGRHAVALAAVRAHRLIRLGVTATELPPLAPHPPAVPPTDADAASSTSNYTLPKVIDTFDAIEKGKTDDKSDSETAEYDRLGVNERDLIRAMAELNATAEGRRKTRPAIVRHFDPNADPDKYKRAAQNIVEAEIAESQDGRGGGYWLTPKGRRFANRIAQQDATTPPRRS